MYNKFFGFKEKPFKLVPNPEYLFLSKSHEEALAHLSYAISHGDGFVEITGEVGTGKTTLCRVFLEGLDASIEAAYIFNPKLDALQLLKAINDEFGIDSSPDNTKDLIDLLNEFLIEKKKGGKKVLVLVDEAQNLSREVLEQLRLLSNLETTQEKLLQIILVGQPELGDTLSSHELRQLGQRITINCRLVPLTFRETKDYIRHRISLASHRAGPPFDRASYRAIYDFSKGVPRLINIACDRILLNAFSRNSFKVTGSIAKEAIRELSRQKTSERLGMFQAAPGLVIAAAIALLVASALLYINRQPVLHPVTENIPAAKVPTTQVPAADQQETIPPEKNKMAAAASTTVAEKTAETTELTDEKAAVESEKGLATEEAAVAEIPAVPPAVEVSPQQAIEEIQNIDSAEKAVRTGDTGPENVSGEVAVAELSGDKQLQSPVKTSPNEAVSTVNIHTVHAGSFQSVSQATSLVEELKGLGFPSFMYSKATPDGHAVFVVAAGKYPSYTPAKNASEQLKRKGYSNFIAKARDSLAAGPPVVIELQQESGEPDKEDGS